MTLDLAKHCGSSYRDGELTLEQVRLKNIAAEFGTPVYCYSTEILERNFRQLSAAFKDISPRICFAVKANSNIAVLRTLALLGAGADVVSEGELRRAITAGIPANKIVFAGVGKKMSEIRYALELGIAQFNVESEAELTTIADVASTLDQRAPVALRVNPDVDAHTDAKITTGTQQTKFGIPSSRVIEVYSEVSRNPSLELQGLSVHIGSQLTELGPFRRAFAEVTALARELKSMGLPVPGLDLGGGIGVTQGNEIPPSFDDYAKLIEELTSGIGCEITIEPGRCLAGNAGLLLSEVILTKEQASRSFVVLDAAMNDLLRPGLYEAYHKIIPVNETTASAAHQPVDFVGPVCETSDTFCRDEHAPVMVAGDLVAILTTGAYGAVMASTYNTRPLVPEVMVRGSDYAVIRGRESYDDMISRDRLPGWLPPPAR